MELTILSLLLVLLAAWAGGAVSTRLGYPAVLGEILAGIIAGPALLGWLGEGDAYLPLQVLADTGVLLLMLYIGMEIDPKELAKASWGGFLAAIGGFITSFALAIAAVVGLGGTLTAGMFVGLAAGVTSLAVNSRIVVDLKILDTRIAHVMLAGALIADTLALLVFAGVIGFAKQGAVEASALLNVIARAVLFFGGTLLIGFWVLPLVFKLLQRLGVTHRLTYFTLILLIALAAGEAAELAGLHAILGTFFAGLFLREGMLEPKLNRELNDLVRDISIGFLAPVFFVLTGFHVSFDVFKTDLLLFFAILTIAFVGKIGGTLLFYLPTRHGWREGLVLGAGMNGRGAVEIIIAGIGLRAGLISEEIFSILVFMAIITTATVPLFLKWGTSWLRKRGELAMSAEKRNTVLIVGCTPLARTLAKLLAETRPVWMIDSNPGRVEEAVKEGLNAVVGNALETESLSKAHAPQVGLALTMTGNAEINALAARHLRDVFLVPHLHVLVLGKDRTADTQTFAHLDASMLFAQAVSLADWDHWFQRGQAEVKRMPAPGDSAAGILRELAGAAPKLPLAIEREVAGKKQIIPFHAGIKIEPADTMVVAQSRTVAQPASDRFDELVKASTILDINEGLDREAFFTRAAEALAAGSPETPAQISSALHDREHMSSTVLTPGLAVPHIILEGENRFAVLIVRCKPGVLLGEAGAPVSTLFVMAGTRDQRNFHLKALSAIAQIWQNKDFETRWREAKGVDELRQILLSAQRQRTS